MRAFHESSSVWKQHGSERYGTGLGGRSDRSGIHGWVQLCLDSCEKTGCRSSR